MNKQYIANKPPGTLITINSTHYKIGRHGMAFMFVGGEWLRSTRTADSLKKMVLKRERQSTRNIRPDSCIDVLR